MYMQNVSTTALNRSGGEVRVLWSMGWDWDVGSVCLELGCMVWSTNGAATQTGCSMLSATRVFKYPYSLKVLPAPSPLFTLPFWHRPLPFSFPPSPSYLYVNLWPLYCKL